MKSAFAISAMVAVCFATALPCALSQTKSRSPQQTYDDPDGYEVLSLLLNRLSDLRKNDTIRIDPHSAPETIVAEIKAQCSAVPDEFRSAWTDFDKKIEPRLTWRKSFGLAKPYELAYAEPIPPTSKAESKEAHKRIRSGTYYLAPVGFNENRTRAVAFVEYLCGSLCGDSIFYFLRKSERGWTEVPEVQRQVQTCGRIY